MTDGRPRDDPYDAPHGHPPYIPGPATPQGPEDAGEATEIMAAVPGDDEGTGYGPGLPGPFPEDPETVGLRRPADLTDPGRPPGPGRAERRRAARGKPASRRRARPAGAAQTPAAPPADAAEVTGGRAARRRAAKAAAKAARQTGTAISNVIGELFITTGVVMLLFVVYQLWWTNYRAQAHANTEADNLTEQWDQQDTGGTGDEGDEEPEDDRDPGVFSPGEGFAILYLPTLDIRVPIAEGVDKEDVLDQGLVGHYTEDDGLPTAMPWEDEGNFGLAGHRNTHGEPFRYINNLEDGDPIVVETEDAFYTYEVTSRLDSTSPSNVSVLDPLPEQGGFTEPGRYITLTTCTPEFTSTYRLIVWGTLTDERPRSEGTPDALTD
ncbi:class E sortase [Streptomyces sp. RFCAC02]|uniref:class E sortase n=1 Tax=Streptomyces sp. RFCAC02 TaxID=2499143 RepID=UPI001F0D5A8B|nr:class E sortase [Streptomyces sp. RFCAC02]